MTALRFKENTRPHDYYSGIQPMAEDDAKFWRWMRQTKPHLYGRTFAERKSDG